MPSVTHRAEECTGLHTSLPSAALTDAVVIWPRDDRMQEKQQIKVEIWPLAHTHTHTSRGAEGAEAAVLCVPAHNYLVSAESGAHQAGSPSTNELIATYSDTGPRGIQAQPV